MTLTYGQVAEIIRNIDLQRDDAQVNWGAQATSGGFWFEIRCWRTNIYTKRREIGFGGPRSISPNATESQIVRAVFAALLAFDEHETRETFLYKGARVFGPHITVDALVEVAGRVDHEVPA